MHRHVNFSLLVCLMLICVAHPTHATTTCSYDFTSGSGNTYLSYCVTVNGNILEIVTPFGQSMLGANGEGYGICNESPAQNYTDYGVSDTGNWNNAIVLSQLDFGQDCPHDRRWELDTNSNDHYGSEDLLNHGGTGAQEQSIGIARRISRPIC